MPQKEIAWLRNRVFRQTPTTAAPPALNTEPFSRVQRILHRNTSLQTGKLFSSGIRRTLRSSATGLSVAAAATTFKKNYYPGEIQSITKKNMHSKVVIIGSGPAAHTAAVYLARAELKRELPGVPRARLCSDTHTPGSSCVVRGLHGERNRCRRPTDHDHRD